MKAAKTKQSHVGKNKKASGDWHVSHTSMGMGDYYGTGVKAPLGKIRKSVGPPIGYSPFTKQSKSRPPKSLA